MDKAQAYIRNVRAHYPTLMAKTELDQHFLASDTAIERELAGLDLKPRERAAELGAGIGSVAQAFPPATELDLVELDPSLCAVLRDSFAPRERTHIVQGDALSWIKTHRVDVLLCNLPWELDATFFALLEQIASTKQQPNRVVAAIHPQLGLEQLGTDCPSYTLYDEGLIPCDAFWPPQGLPSRLVLAVPR